MQPLQQPSNGTTTPAATAKPPSRMALANIVTGRQVVPMRVVIYGDGGLGKSTFAAGSPSPIFLGSEDGTSELDVSRFPPAQSMEDVSAALSEMLHSEHPFRTLCIDSLDWLEPMIWDKVCRDEKSPSIEKVGGGYGKGYTAALELWRGFLASLDQLRHKRGMHIVCVAHAVIKTYQNPDGDDYDRFILKLNEKASGIIREWSDAVLFAQQKTFTVENEKTKRSKGISTGERVMYTEQRPAFYAKNRYGLPFEMPLSWASFEEALAERNPQAIRDRIEAMLVASTDTEFVAKVRGYLGQIGDNVQRLCEAENRVKEKTK